MPKARVLVVEDEKKIANVTLAYLNRAGYEPVHAETGEQALGLFKEGFDLVILDLMLPDMDGEEICRHIRSLSDVPIIMVTAKSDEDDRVEGLGLGADDYVVKPFSPRELMARVEAHLRRTIKTSAARSFNSGALVINGQSMEAVRDGKSVSLTPTEFRMLQAMAERPQTVFSRHQLVTIAQGHDFEGYERTIDAHVKNLRQKIEKNPRQPEFIKTVYGIGYKFIGTKDAD
jgi:DNA-binding response OmpR family regulator